MPRSKSAPTSYFEDPQGLHIGVQSAAPGQWAGFFAKSPNTNAQVFHAILTLPYSSIPADVFNTGLYVQTSSGFINYVACYTQVTSSGYFWSVLYSTGDSSSAQSFHQVYFQQGGPNVPLTPRLHDRHQRVERRSRSILMVSSYFRAAHSTCRCPRPSTRIWR